MSRGKKCGSHAYKHLAILYWLISTLKLLSTIIIPTIVLITKFGFKFYMWGVTRDYNITWSGHSDSYKYSPWAKLHGCVHSSRLPGYETLRRNKLVGSSFRHGRNDNFATLPIGCGKSLIHTIFLLFSQFSNIFECWNFWSETVVRFANITFAFVQLTGPVQPYPFPRVFQNL